MDVNKNIINSDKTIKGKVSVNNEEKERYNVKFNDLFLTRTSETSDEIGLTSAFIGKDENTVFSGFILRARPKKDNINSMFYAYYMRSNKMRNNIIKYSSITTRALINSQNLSKLKIAVPSIKEQDKIFHMLWNFDKKIEFLNNKLKIVIIFKKYLLQNLFPKSGELAPKLRFKNEKGENYSNWNKTSINDVIVESKTKNENNENLPVISSTLTGICLQKEYFNKKVSSKDIKNYKIVCKGYFTYRSMSDTGKFRFNIQNILDKAIVSPAYPVFKTKSCINSKFFELYLNYNPLIKKQILYIKEGGTRYALSISKLKKMNIIIPSMEEQEKIADYLTEVDNKIDLIQVQIDKMEEFKKGLLQQMFEFLLLVFLFLIFYKYLCESNPIVR